MKKKSFYLMLTLVMTGAASVNAQVLIGGTASDEPHSGAILDLASGGQNNLGMLLPTVELSDDASEFVLVPEGTVTGDIKQTATGMIVYNTTYALRGPGVYVWDGSKWMPLRDPCPNSITDERDGNVYCIGDFGAAGWWMTQNMRYKGTLIEGTHYHYPNGSKQEEYEDDHGLLYTWASALAICPDGWRLPAASESELLNTELENDANQKYSTDTEVGFAGRKARWGTNVDGLSISGTSKAKTEGGFAGRMCGEFYGVQYGGYGESMTFWHSTHNFAAWRLDNDDAMLIGPTLGIEEFPSIAYSVRCVQD
ncbi:MAG: hypothetical protein LBH61_00870 [Dysgonamonadaceae bacterium]|jgi:uncharacterized protein (TIGR02145 family)|nr:hypothetical protein [Dysgonamonadaceae bacterium]